MFTRQDLTISLVAFALFLIDVQAFSPAAMARCSVTTSQTQFTPSALAAIDDDDEEEFGIIDEPAQDDYILTAGELEGGDADDELAPVEDQPSPRFLSEERMEALRAQHRLHDKDTGSPEYQVAGITERISYLTSHLQKHPKDFSTRRGLVALVNKRRRLLNYLSKEDVQRYKSLVSSLGVRHKAPGAVPDRAEKYGRFPNQKAIKKHLVKK